MTKEELNTSLDEISIQVDLDFDISVPITIMEKIQRLTNMIGLSAECYAWSEKFYNDKLGGLILAKEYKSLSATDKKILFGSLASNEIMVMSKAERLNKGIIHGIDGLRSLLSYLKEEYRQTQNG